MQFFNFESELAIHEYQLICIQMNMQGVERREGATHWRMLTGIFILSSAPFIALSTAINEFVPEFDSNYTCTQINSH